MFAKPKIKVRMKRKSWRKTVISSEKAGAKKTIRDSEKER